MHSMNEVSNGVSVDRVQSFFLSSYVYFCPVLLCELLPHDALFLFSRMRCHRLAASLTNSSGSSTAALRRTAIKRPHSAMLLPTLFEHYILCILKCHVCDVIKSNSAPIIQDSRLRKCLKLLASTVGHVVRPISCSAANSCTM